MILLKYAKKYNWVRYPFASGRLLLFKKSERKMQNIQRKTKQHWKYFMEISKVYEIINENRWNESEDSKQKIQN